MKNPIKYLVNGISNLGTKSGMPKYTAFLGLLQGGILFIPESILAKLGVDALQIQGWCPEFVQYYIINSSFKNAMSVFWLLSPFTLTICTALFVLHANGDGYPAYLCRRSIRLKMQGKPSISRLFSGCWWRSHCMCGVQLSIWLNRRFLVLLYQLKID